MLRLTEDVVLRTRQHWSVPVLRGLLPATIGLAALVTVAGTAPQRASWPSPWPAASVWLLALVAVAALGRLVWVYLDWVDDRLLITTDRVIWIEQTAFIRETMRELQLTSIVAVDVHEAGAIARWFAIGDIALHLAAGPPLIVRGIAAAQEVGACLGAQQEALRQRQRQGAHRAVTDLVQGIVRPTVTTPATAVSEASAPPAPLVWRRHWSGLVAAVMPATLLLLTAGGVAFALPLVVVLPAAASELCRALVALAAVGIGSWWLASAVIWRRCHLVLAGDHLTRHEARLLGTQTRTTELPLSAISDVGYQIPNPLARLLGVGDLIVHTSARPASLIWRGVAHPRAVQAAISDRLASIHALLSRRGATTDQDVMLSMLQSYHELLRGGSDAATL